ncbi:hypothetical protein BH09PSE4_BH09PSE4_07240 [soil metagenome]
MSLILALLLAAQTTPVQPMPKGTALPPPGTEEAAVLAPINALFAAFEAGDGPAVLRQVYADGRVTASGMTGAGSLRQGNWSAFATSMTPGQGFQERISDPAIEIDGDIAMVWAPFVVRVGGKLSNCGIDHFDLIRKDGAWKAMNLTFSSRTTGCPAE